MPRVLLTDPIHPKADTLLRDFAETVVLPDASPETLYQLAAGVDGIIVRRRLPEDIFTQAPRVKFVVRHGAGTDLIPLKQAASAGVRVANVPGVNACAVAEFAFAMLLHLRRSMALIDNRFRNQGWAAEKIVASGGSMLAGTTLGIIGMGYISRHLTKIASGFGMNVVSVRHHKPLPPNIREVNVDDLFISSDHIVLSCPLTEQTHRLVSSRQLNMMKQSAVLINVARGSVIDTSALLSALRTGRISGAVCDVHDVQPLPADSDLFDYPNLFLTSHCAGSVPSVTRDIGIGAVEEMRRLLAGKPALNPVLSDS